MLAVRKPICFEHNDGHKGLGLAKRGKGFRELTDAETEEEEEGYRVGA
jgi:hypothetical protein